MKVTHDFVDICLKFMLCKSENPVEDKELIRTTSNKCLICGYIKFIIYHYIESIIKKDKGNNAVVDLPNINPGNSFIPVNLFIAKLLSEKISENPNQDASVILSSTPYSAEYSDRIIYFENASLSLAELKDIISTITIRYKFAKLLKKDESYTKLIEKIRKNKFSVAHDVVTEYEKVITDMYFDLCLTKDSIADNIDVNADKKFPKHISTNRDNLQSLIKNMLEVKKSSNTTKSGFKVFDEEFSHGGFEPGRIYILTGVSGFGKSMWMLSSAVKSAEYYDSIAKPNNQDPQAKQVKNVYIFISAENQIYETLSRYITMRLNKITESELLNWEEAEINENLNKLVFNNSFIEFIYVDPYKTNITDIIMHIERTINKYGELEKENPNISYALKAVYVDYLDLIKPIQTTDLYRLELGFVTMELKSIAIKYSVPVITLTQMNDYNFDNNITKYKMPPLSSLTESRKKVENADTILVLHGDVELLSKMQINDNEDLSKYQKTENELFGIISVIKNRGHKKGKFHVYIDYEYRKIIGLNDDRSCNSKSEYFQTYISHFKVKGISIKQFGNFANTPISGNVATFDNNIIKNQNEAFQNTITYMPENTYNNTDSSEMIFKF